MEINRLKTIMKMYAILAQYTLYYLSLLCLIIISISSTFIYSHWYLKDSNTSITNINPGIQTIIY